MRFLLPLTILLFTTSAVQANIFTDAIDKIKALWKESAEAECPHLIAYIEGNNNPEGGEIMFIKYEMYDCAGRRDQDEIDNFYGRFGLLIRAIAELPFGR